MQPTIPDITVLKRSHWGINEIASTLSKICLFGGRCSDFYSVAQHSYIVSYVVPPEHAMAGLLHDSAKAFMGYIPQPLKQLLPDYTGLYNIVQQDVLRHLGITELPSCIEHADRIVLATEKRDLKPEHDDLLTEIVGVEPLEMRIDPWSPLAAKALFLSRYYDIKAKTNAA